MSKILEFYEEILFDESKDVNSKALSVLRIGIFQLLRVDLVILTPFCLKFKINLKFLKFKTPEFGLQHGQWQ